MTDKFDLDIKASDLAELEIDIPEFESEDTKQETKVISLISESPDSEDLKEEPQSFLDQIASLNPGRRDFSDAPIDTRFGEPPIEEDDDFSLINEQPILYERFHANGDDQVEVVDNQLSYDDDLNADTDFHHLPVDRQTTEFILIRGMFSQAFKDFISSKSQLKDGWLPVAVEINGEIIAIRKITPDPKALYALKKTLAGFDISVFDGTEYKPLDVYAYLGKIKFEVGSRGANDLN